MTTAICLSLKIDDQASHLKMKKLKIVKMILCHFQSTFFWKEKVPAITVALVVFQDFEIDNIILNFYSLV